MTVAGICVAPWVPVNPSKLAVDRICQALSIAFLNVLALRAVIPATHWWRNRTKGETRLLDELKSAFPLRYVAYVVRAALAVQLTLLWFCCLKYVIPWLRPTLFDDLLSSIDTAIHMGVNPSALAVSLSQSFPTLLHWTDAFYVGYFPILLLFFAYVMIQEKRPHLRDPFVFGYCLFWLLGGLSYFLLPSMGPIYHQPALFESIMPHMPLASQLNHELLVDYRAFVAAPWEHEPMLYYGIAAMPSLHVGACAMFTCFARRFGRVVFVIMLTLTTLMFVGSLITGWHYAIDGYAGALLGWLSYRIAMRDVGRSEISAQPNRPGSTPRMFAPSLGDEAGG
ncbi:MAG: phosphatase PAP2 family protein [Phycisphaerales bacterium]|nr:phosphatase PAP2 family protein [Phycisphaerales bacterium]MCB9855599.1 phosphatase PAP2 family protein [Phycisphaerales bacterium]MCB9864912.1 phosphatase PAP2 family protein [Phycisphaerales bacterium]